MAGEEEVKKIRRDATHEVVLRQEVPMIFDSMEVKITMADGQTVVIRGKRPEGEETPYYDAEVEGVSIAPGDPMDTQLYAEQVLLNACWRLLGWDMDPPSEEVAGE